MAGRGVVVCLLLVACSDGDVAGKGGGARDGSTEEAGGQASQTGGRPGTGGGASGGGSGALGAGGAAGPADAATEAAAGAGGRVGHDGAIPPDEAREGGLPGTGGATKDASSDTGSVANDAAADGAASALDASADTGSTLPDASVDAGGSFGDASSEAGGSSRDASDASRTCSYPTLGIDRLASGNAAYVLASLVRIEWLLTEMARVATTSLVTETRADTLPSGDPLEITAHFTQQLTVIPPARPICSSPGTRQVWTLTGVAGMPGATVRLADGRVLEIALGALVREDETGGRLSPRGCTGYSARQISADYVVKEIQTGRTLQVATTAPLELTWSGSLQIPGLPFASGARTTTDHEGHVAALMSLGGTTLSLAVDGVTTRVSYEALYLGPGARPCGTADACEACPGASEDAGSRDAGTGDAAAGD